MDTKELEKQIKELDTGLGEDGKGETPDELIEPEDHASILEGDK